MTQCRSRDASPTTQGKNERFHQTLFRYLDKPPLAGSLEQLQGQVDAFDLLYNVNRPHQALPGRATPQAAWDAIPKADAPRPLPAEQRRAISNPAAIPAPQGRAADGIRVATIHLNGTITARGVWFKISHTRRGQDVYVIYEREGIMIFDDRGTLIIERPWPAPGVRYVGNGQPRGPPKTV